MGVRQGRRRTGYDRPNAGPRAAAADGVAEQRCTSRTGLAWQYQAASQHQNRRGNTRTGEAVAGRARQ
jgi:hypothetical protein